MLVKLYCTAICWLIPIFSVTIANRAYSDQPFEVKSDIRSLTQLASVKTSATYLLRTPRDKNQVSQLSPATTDVVSVTDVKVNITDKGIELILVAANSVKLSVSPKIEGNSYIVNIPNAKLQLKIGQSFRQKRPVAGIALITVANVDTNTLRVTVTGETAAPVVELFDSQTEGLVFGVTSTGSTPQQPAPTPEQKLPANDQNQTPIELEVTAPPEGSYRVPNTSSGTKTDTPLRDIPQSVQVIPRQVIDDLGAKSQGDVLRTVGIGSALFNSQNFDDPKIRGFRTSFSLRNGIRDITSSFATDISNTERFEVLRGPASVLYGQIVPGGVVNRVTKQPLNEPYYSAQMRVGSYDFYQPSIDLSGPLNEKRTLLYRLNASYLNTNSFGDFLHQERYFVAPAFTLLLGKSTNLTVDGEYQNVQKPNGDFFISGQPALGTVLFNPNGKIPRSRNIGEPSSDNSYREVSRIGYSLEHRFNDNWVLHNAFRFGSVSILQQDITIGTGLQSDNRTLNRLTVFDSNVLNGYIVDTNLVGQLKTGNIEHKLLIGFDWYRETVDLSNIGFARAPIDVFNPVYGSPLSSTTGTTQTQRINNTFGLYFQDQITLTDNLKLVLGGRFDWLDFDSRNRINGVKTTQSDDAFSPRVGIVYQPLKDISLYASYSRSFEQVTGNDVRGNPFVPSRGTQYEVGVKTDLFNSNLSTTLALYDLTQTNVTTSDPNNPSFNIQTGEQRIRGVELISIGELAPSWKIIASYIYTDPRITSDRTFSGNFISNSPEHTASLWTTYTIPKGSLQGLGFGFGVFYVGDRFGDNANTFILPSYVRTDAAIYYRRNNLKVQLNLQNLFDTLYYDAALNRSRVNPGNPFEAALNISWEF